MNILFLSVFMESFGFVWRMNMSEADLKCPSIGHLLVDLTACYCVLMSAKQIHVLNPKNVYAIGIFTILYMVCIHMVRHTWSKPQVMTTFESMPRSSCSAPSCNWQLCLWCLLLSCRLRFSEMQNIRAVAEIQLASVQFLLQKIQRLEPTPPKSWSAIPTCPTWEEGAKARD